MINIIIQAKKNKTRIKEYITILSDYITLNKDMISINYKNSTLFDYQNYTNTFI